MSVSTDIEQVIRQRLAGFDPQLLELVDDSAAHAGHAGAAGGGGHYTVTIVSDRFAGKPRVARHRMVYDALGPLMQQRIHALALTTRTPAEHQSGGGTTFNPKETR